MNERKLILDIICTSRNISGYRYHLPSIRKGSKCLLKVEEAYRNANTELKKEYDGAKWETISNLKERKEIVDANVEDLVSKLRDKIPHKRPRSSYAFQINKIETIELQSFCLDLNRFKRKSDEVFIEVLKYSGDDVEHLLKPFRSIGVICAKLNALQEIENQVAKIGVYNYCMKFTSVPDACRYFLDVLGENATKEKIKERIEEEAVVYENGTELNDKGTINSRINSWRQNLEKNEGTFIPLN